jgi:serine/threonine-protein kinase
MPSESSRYEPIVKLASGGMGTVYLGAAKGALGFRQLVAIKRPHQHLLDDARFRATLLAEAKVASNIRHANVVDVRDIEIVDDTIHLVMDYVEGASLGQIIVAWSNGKSPLPARAAVRIILDACAGLHAAHEQKVVHRDVSPQNILVGVDGVSRVTDFGTAKSTFNADQPTTQGTLKGKVGYMAPEYIKGRPVDRRVDIFGMGVVLWEALSGKRLFRGESEGDTLEKVLRTEVPPILPALDAVIAKALAREPEGRFATAGDFKWALEEAASAAGLLGTHDEVAAHVRATVGEDLEKRRAAVRDKLAGEVVMVTEAPTRAATPVAKKRFPWTFVGVALAIGTAGAATIVWAPSSAPADHPASRRRASRRAPARGQGEPARGPQPRPAAPRLHDDRGASIPSAAAASPRHGHRPHRAAACADSHGDADRDGQASAAQPLLIR